MTATLLNSQVNNRQVVTSIQKQRTTPDQPTRSTTTISSIQVPSKHDALTHLHNGAVQVSTEKHVSQSKANYLTRTSATSQGPVKGQWGTGFAISKHGKDMTPTLSKPCSVLASTKSLWYSGDMSRIERSSGQPGTGSRWSIEGWFDVQSSTPCLCAGLSVAQRRSWGKGWPSPGIDEYESALDKAIRRCIFKGGSCYHK